MQAARGTSLSRDDSRLDAAGPAPSPVRFRVLLAVVFAVLYATDQVTKALAVQHLDGEPDKQLVGDLLVLHLTRNPGAAFSAGVAYTEVLSCIAIAAVLTVLWLSRRVRSMVWALGFGVLLAGIAGNLTDRLLREPGPLRGHVVDFLMLPNWPVFNIADICINVAAAVILVQAFRGVRLDGTRPEQDDAEPTEPTEPGQPGDRTP